VPAKLKQTALVALIFLSALMAQNEQNVTKKPQAATHNLFADHPA
jgi:hypothetical protein